MRKANYKGKCQKRSMSKCTEVCRTYDEIQFAYADVLENREDVVEFTCNVSLEGLEAGAYTSDFVCTKANGELMVRERVWRKHITKPMTARLLDLSRDHWFEHGVTDWGIVIDEEK